MPNPKLLPRTLVALAAVAGLAAATAPVQVASASGGDDVRIIQRGRCAGGTALWKVKVKSDDGRLEVEGEIDSNRRGQVWAWRIVHNGSVSHRGRATTAGASGSFSVERRIVDLAGTDRVVFRAVRGTQVCRGVVNY